MSVVEVGTLKKVFYVDAISDVTFVKPERVRPRAEIQLPYNSVDFQISPVQPYDSVSVFVSCSCPEMTRTDVRYMLRRGREDGIEPNAAGNVVPSIGKLKRHLDSLGRGVTLPAGRTAREHFDAQFYQLGVS